MKKQSQLEKFYNELSKYTSFSCSLKPGKDKTKHPFYQVGYYDEIDYEKDTKSQMIIFKSLEDKCNITVIHGSEIAEIKCNIHPDDTEYILSFCNYDECLYVFCPHPQI